MSTSTPASAGFSALGVPSELVAVLTSSHIRDPFPIQEATLPDTLAGRDVLGRGQTGSGKTLAFSLPLVARLARLVPSAKAIPARTRPGRPRALVLAPTRELAAQIHTTIRPLAAAVGLRVSVIYGGVPQYRQVQQLERGVDIVVATPGRLEDLIGQGHLHLDQIQVTVLDEADHMADLGFLPGVTRILEATPAGGQRLMFSATLDKDVDKLVRKFLVEPLVHSVDSEQSPVAAMTHHVLVAGGPTQKRELVRRLAGGKSRRMFFTRTKHHARKLARELTAAGVPAVELHGNLSQSQRDRGLKAFADGEVRVMVATDIAARGIHVDGVELVVHVDPPAEHKAYLHRSGRTARAGSEGDVVTVVLPNQTRDFKALAKAAKIDARPTKVEPDDATVQALVGGEAQLVDPHHAPAAAARVGGAPDERRGRGQRGDRDQRRPERGPRSRDGRSTKDRDDRPAPGRDDRQLRDRDDQARGDVAEARTADRPERRQSTARAAGGRRSGAGRYDSRPGFEPSADAARRDSGRGMSSRSDRYDTDRRSDRYADRSGRPAGSVSDRYADRRSDRSADRSGDRPVGSGSDRYADRGGDRYADRGGDRSGDRRPDRYGADRGNDRYADRRPDRRDSDRRAGSDAGRFDARSDRRTGTGRYDSERRSDRRSDADSRGRSGWDQERGGRSSARPERAGGRSDRRFDSRYDDRASARPERAGAEGGERTEGGYPRQSKRPQNAGGKQRWTTDRRRAGQGGTGGSRSSGGSTSRGSRVGGDRARGKATGSRHPSAHTKRTGRGRSF